jgi:putative MATE family efflux protein
MYYNQARENGHVVTAQSPNNPERRTLQDFQTELFLQEPLMKTKEVNMLSGSITRGLLSISIPIMIMNVVQSLFNIIDMTILKTYDTGDGIAVGAVGVCGTLISLITGFVIGVSTGANVIIARNIGRKDSQSMDRAIGSAMAFSLLSGAGLAVIGVSCANVFLRWINCPESLLAQATLYFRMYFTGAPLLMIYNFCAAILRASGDSRSPMLFLTVSGIFKVTLNFLLIAVFRLGVFGVGLSTILAWALVAFLGLRTLIRSNGIVQIRIRSIRFYQPEISQIMHIGVPSGLQQMLYSIANVIITTTVNSYGPEATTGISIANNFDGILYQICHATSLAIMPYVSQNIGSGNVKRAVSSIWKGILVTCCLGASFGALSAIFSKQLSSIMSSNPTVIAYSQQKMIIISSTYFICGINDIIGAALRGMGKSLPATIATLFFMCLFRFVWVYLIYPLAPNLTFLYLVWPIGWILSIISLLFVLVPTIRKFQESSPYSKAIP